MAIDCILTLVLNMIITANKAHKHYGLFVCVFFIYFVIPIKCRINVVRFNFEEETTTIASTTPANVEPTDIPQADIDDALILDYGRYTTVSFHYEQHQWMHPHWDERCYDDYTKCITSQAGPMPVCMFHSQLWRSGSKYTHSYCDAYLENCRIGYRYWRLIGNGKCSLGQILFGWDEMIEV